MRLTLKSCSHGVLALAAGSLLMSSQLHAQQDTTVFGWSERKLTAVILSTVIPGAGQSYLGHTTKGAAITVGAFGSGLITILAQNNVVGRNERLDELNALYQQSNNWETSDILWRKMLETKGILDRDVKRRDLFAKFTALLWVASIVDIVLFSDDLGAQTFGSTSTAPKTSLTVQPHPNGGVNTTLSYRF